MKQTKSEITPHGEAKESKIAKIYRKRAEHAQRCAEFYANLSEQYKNEARKAFEAYDAEIRK